MQHTAHLLLILSLIIHSFASSVPDTLCPDGKPGVTVQLAAARLHPFQPATYTTDCSRTPLHKRSPLIEKRQENQCSADAPAVCNNDSSLQPGVTDCQKLIADLNSSRTLITIQASQTLVRDYNTCRLTLINTINTAFIYCETSWAAHAADVMNQCFSNFNGGFAQGSRFSLVVGFNPTYQSVTPTTPQPTSNPPVTQPGTNNGGSSNNSGSSAQNTAGGTNGNSSGSSSANGSTGSGTNTSVTVSGSTTLSGGLVVPAAVTLSSPSLPSFGASPTGLSANSEDGSGQSKKSNLVPAIVGALLGILALLFLVLFCCWRRRKRARLLKMAEPDLQGLQEMEEMRYNPIHSLDVPQQQNLGVEEGGSSVSIVGSATSAKAQMAAEEARQARSVGHGRNPSLENVSSLTGGSVVSPVDTATPPYRSQSERQLRGAATAQRPSSSSSTNVHNRYWRGVFGSATVATTPSLITTSSSESSRRHQSTRLAYTSQQPPRRDVDRISVDSGSISPRALAQTAAPNLSAVDIDRLAESIVARIHGRDHTGNPSSVGVGVRSSVLSEGDEPPPPWSAPVAGSV